MAAVEEGQVIICNSVEHFDEQLQKSIQSNKLVVVDFTASWCGPCRFISPIFSDLAKKTPHAIFLKVDVDELKTVAEKYSVEAMPTFIFFKEGKEIDRIVGAVKDDLHLKIAKHATTDTATVSA